MAWLAGREREGSIEEGVVGEGVRELFGDLLAIDPDSGRAHGRWACCADGKLDRRSSGCAGRADGHAFCEAAEAAAGEGADAGVGKQEFDRICAPFGLVSWLKRMSGLVPVVVRMAWTPLRLPVTPHGLFGKAEFTRAFAGPRRPLRFPRIATAGVISVGEIVEAIAIEVGDGARRPCGARAGGKRAVAHGAVSVAGKEGQIRKREVAGYWVAGVDGGNEIGAAVVVDVGGDGYRSLYR